MLEKIERIELPEKKREIRFHFPAPKRSGHKVVEVKNLHKNYGETVVYQGIDLHLSGVTKWYWWVPMEQENLPF